MDRGAWWLQSTGHEELDVTKQLSMEASLIHHDNDLSPSRL